MTNTPDKPETSASRDRPEAPNDASSSLSSASSARQPEASSSVGEVCLAGGEGSQLRSSVKITPKMIDAGIDALREQEELMTKPDSLLHDTAIEVYVAMQAARPV